MADFYYVRVAMIGSTTIQQHWKMGSWVKFNVHNIKNLLLLVSLLFPVKKAIDVAAAHTIYTDRTSKHKK